MLALLSFLNRFKSLELLAVKGEQPQCAALAVYMLVRGRVLECDTHSHYSMQKGRNNSGRA